MNDEYFMKQALQQAHKAFAEEEVPIGAVVVVNNKIISRGHNQVEKLNDPTAHAEIIALTSAFNYLGSKYLPEATIYSTVEPCVMCAGALYWSKIGKIIYGAKDEKNGYLTPWGPLTSSGLQPPFPAGEGKRKQHLLERGNWPLHPKTVVVSHFMKEECGQLMSDFFAQKRK